jgi:predicted nucleic acid-binding protein
MKFDSIELLDQLIQESLFVSLHNGLVNEQAVKSAIIIDPGTLAQQERRKNKYPGSIRSFKVKAKSSSEAAIINNIKSNTDFGDNSKYANGDYAYILGQPVRERESTNMKKYVVLIYPVNNKYFKWFYGSREQQEREIQIQKLEVELNPSMGRVFVQSPKNKIGNSVIYTHDDFNKLKKYNNSQSKQLEDLQSNQEITIQQSQTIDRLKQQLFRQNDEIDQLKNQQQAVTEPAAEQQATLEGAKAVVPERIKDSIWKDPKDGQIKLAVDQNTDYLITLDNNVYKVETSTGTKNLADYE